MKIRSNQKIEYGFDSSWYVLIISLRDFHKGKTIATFEGKGQNFLKWPDKEKAWELTSKELSGFVNNR